MHRLPILAVLALLTLLAPIAVWAADLPVRYTVDEKQLKNAISGTNLTFGLYSDAACTTLADSTVVTIDNVGIRERIKQFKPKNGAAQLKVVELHQTFLGVTAPGNLFLKVTGTGVVPVGGACQAQAAAVAGAGGGGAVVKDGLGTVMGPSLDGGSFLIPVGPTLVRLGVSSSDYLYGVVIPYAGALCTGQAYAVVQPPGLYDNGNRVDATQYFISPTTGGAPISYASLIYSSDNYSSQTDCDNNFGLGVASFVAPHGCCAPFGSTSNLAPLPPLQTLPTFTPPFTLDLP